MYRPNAASAPQSPTHMHSGRAVPVLFPDLSPGVSVVPVLSLVLSSFEESFEEFLLVCLSFEGLFEELIMSFDLIKF